jgi:uncharacterized FlaG/YvyC family protein
MRLDQMMPPGGQAISGAVSTPTAARRWAASTVVQDIGDSNGPDTVKISEAGQHLFEMEKMIANLQEYAGWGNFNINFALDDQTGSLVISIIDRQTGEVLRQIPPDEILSLRSHLQELLKEAFAESA